MAHVHHCKVCGVAVASCADACQQEEDHFCSMHHPDPEHHVEETRPEWPARTVVTRIESPVQVIQVEKA